MVKVITWRLMFLSCPGHWTLLPWITTAKVHRGFAFTWLFFGLSRVVELVEARDV